MNPRNIWRNIYFIFPQMMHTISNISHGGTSIKCYIEGTHDTRHSISSVRCFTILSRRINGTLTYGITGIIPEIVLLGTLNSEKCIYCEWMNTEKCTFSVCLNTEEFTYCEWMNTEECTFCEWLNSEKCTFCEWLNTEECTFCEWLNTEECTFCEWMSRNDDLL